jgi:hypothetical protein
MPYKRIKPATEEEMYRDCHPGHFSICQYLRDIHSGIESEDIKEKVRYCWAWAKRMHDEIKKLHYEKADRAIEELKRKEEET